MYSYTGSPERDASYLFFAFTAYFFVEALVPIKIVGSSFFQKRAL
jgi:hypothetical protein